MFGCAQLADNNEKTQLRLLLQPHLDVQAAIRALLSSGRTVLSDDTETLRVCERIDAMQKQTVTCSIGACTVTIKSRR